jgi:AraC family transcriptional regulator, melibiose operon regulatory protein
MPSLGKLALADNRSIVLESAHIYLIFGDIMPYSEILQQFDEDRPSLAPYGLTCVHWRATRMRRPDRHNEIELNLLESGSLVYLLAGKRVRVHAGRLVAFWAITPHQVVDRDADAPYYVATIPLNCFLRWKLPAGFLVRILEGELVEDASELVGNQDALQFQQWILDLQSASADVSEIVLLQMQARLWRMALSCHPITTEGPSHGPRPRDMASSSSVERMAMFIAANYQRSLRIADISAEVGLHPDYAGALFRKTFGMTLGRYLLEHRVSHAQRLLTTTEEKIGSIGFQAGFDSLSRFNAAFKAVVGCTPREYRVREEVA